jgi:proline dehydrogenase
MLRSFLIYLSKAAWAQKLVTGWSFAWRAASRFVAGEKAEDAIRVVRELNAKGINATLDHLGEHTSTMDEAANATEDILAILDEIDKAKVRANVSIKLTQIGMGLDERICHQNLIRILERAREHNNFVRIDIEDTPYTDTTISTYHTMLERGFTTKTMGMAVQSYLYRAEADVRALLEKGTRFRLVKGAYLEPESIAFRKKKDTDSNFIRLMEILLGSETYHAIATHDEAIINATKEYAGARNIPKSHFEFQMLYGVRRDLQLRLAQEGYRVRVYIPYGQRWYPYFMRRLAERPANVIFILRNLLKE